MSALEAEVSQPNVPLAAKTKQERERSTIEFPYSSLDVAVEIAKAVQATGSSRAGTDVIAAHLNEAAGGGSFRNKIGAARLFGLAIYANETVTLTQLGNRITDPEQEKAAKAEAFLNVPLYKKLYENFKGLMLPPTNAGLEAEIENLGVSSKQKDKARQAFQRSAAFAGFFAYGPTKLVSPVVNGTFESKANKAHVEVESEATPSRSGGSGGDGRKRHPFIEGLLETLPSVGVGSNKTEWSIKDRQDWLQTAAGIFKLIYKASVDDPAGDITVSFPQPPKISAN